MANLRVDKITSTETFETTGSVQFDGSGDYLSHAVSSDFQFGSDDFTIECWIYKEATQNDDILGVYNTSSNRRSFLLHTPSEGTIVFILSPTGSGGTTFTTDENIIEPSTWYHIAVVRNGNDVKIFKDGSLVKSGSYTGSVYENNDDEFRIGSTHYSAANSREFDGHISNVRIIKGTALYTANFKPPMRELEVVPGTVVLACQSKTDASLEKTGKTITVNGNAVASELTPGILTPVPKAGAGSAITGSVEFSGAPAATVGTDYLNVSSTDFAFGTSDFSVEMWFNSGDVSADGQRGLIQLSDTVGGLKTDYTSGFVIATGVNNAGNASVNDIYSQILGDNLGSNNDPLRNDTWHHVALTRQSGTARLFLNGILLGSSSAAESISAEHLVIGGWYSTSYLHRGFISNLRIVKGTALYTEDFIPPTRELKKVPGTVLLCCQDPDSPLTEATGKTITGYGSLNQSYGTDLVTNGQFTADSDWTKGDQWTISGGSASITDSPDRGSDSLLTQDASSWIQAGQMYRVAVDWSFSNGDFDIRLGGDSTYTEYSIESSQSSPYFFNIRAGATNDNLAIIANQHAVGDINSISVEKLPPSRTGSNFTPQVGDDRKVTFEGVTKINTENYFYLPTGNTESRDRGGGVRGVFVRGQSDTPSPALVQTIEYINISSTGNAIDFGDAAAAAGTVGACSDSTRGIQGGGQTPSGPTVTADILKLTIASTGTAVDSGADLLSAANYVEALSSSTRAVFVGGSPPGSNVLQFTEIQSLGNTVDFGDLNNSVFGEGTCCDGVRGVIFGGTTGPTPGDRIDNIDYITVSSKGDAQDFGNLGAARAQGSGFSNKIRGIYAGGRYQPQNNIIEYVTIATTGDAKDFGDLISQASRDGGGTCSSTRGVHAGGDANPSPTADVNTIQYITIMSMGNAFDFGDLTERKTHIGACSNGHGGLG